MGFSIYEQADADSMSEAPLLPIIIPGRCWRFQVPIECSGALLHAVASEPKLSGEETG